MGPFLNPATLVLAGALIVAAAGAASAQKASEAVPPAPAPAPESTFSKIERGLADALQKGLDLFSTTVDKVVPYKKPEVLPNGDIIIRYAPATPKAEPPPAPPPTANDSLKT